MNEWAYYTNGRQAVRNVLHAEHPGSGACRPLRIGQSAVSLFDRDGKLRPIEDVLRELARFVRDKEDS